MFLIFETKYLFVIKLFATPIYPLQCKERVVKCWCCTFLVELLKNIIVITVSEWWFKLFTFWVICLSFVLYTRTVTSKYCTDVVTITVSTKKIRGTFYLFIYLFVCLFVLYVLQQRQKETISENLTNSILSYLSP